MSKHRLRISSTVLFAGLAILLIAVPALAQSAGVARPTAKILGAVDPSQQISVTFWLKQHDKAGLDNLVRQMYDPNSPNYHHWLTPKQYEARFAPSAADMSVVKQYLASNNLQVVHTEKFNHAVTARGTVADVQRATGVQLNRATINGEAHRLPSAEPAIGGAAGKLVYAVQGLTDFRYNNYARRAVDPSTGKAAALTPLSYFGPVDKFFNKDCLRDTQTRTFKTGGSGPYATYTGTRYGSNINSGPPNLAPCGYNAKQVDKAYGITPLLKQGLDGTGQTVVIVDAYGSDTITSDANTFSAINGLPPLTPSNFQIYYPTGPTDCGGNTCGWDVETSIDVEWSHSLAPGANIALVLALDNSNTNLDLSVLYAIIEGLGPVISNSYGIDEILLQIYEPGELTVENNISETGAALGISVNFSSGDSGDYFVSSGGIYQTVSMPASAPYSTGVGGTSLFINSDNTIKMQTGWGNNLTAVAQPGSNPPYIPPFFEGFVYGAGGGASGVWSKPSYQWGLPGNSRLVPDIGFLADPYTGGEVIFTEGGQTYIAVYGGTSLACPMFSGVWALAVQAAGTWLWPGCSNSLQPTFQCDHGRGCHDRACQREWHPLRAALSSHLLLS